MHVLVYGPSCEKMGGIESFLFSMNEFMPADIEFDYVIEGTESIHQATIERLGGKVEYITPKRRIVKNILDWRRFLKNMGDNYDVAYFNMYSLSWILPIVFCLKRGFRVVVHAHNNALHTGGPLLWMHKFCRRILRHKKIVRLTNSELSSSFFFYPEDDVQLIHNAIDIDRFAFNEDARDQTRESLGVAGRTVYAFVGRLDWQKRPEFVVDVFAEIHRIEASSFFLVVGNGSLRQAMEDRAKRRGIDIVFAGECMNPERFYSAADALLLPSRFEGLGIVLIEAQASGIPCATTANKVPDIVAITDLVSFVPYEATAMEWAQTIVNATHYKPYSRLLYADILRDTEFNIEKESCVLADILKG